MWGVGGGEGKKERKRERERERERERKEGETDLSQVPVAQGVGRVQAPVPQKKHRSPGDGSFLGFSECYFLG
jgi:hypothetical protein